MQKLQKYLPPTEINAVVYHHPCCDGFGAAYVFWRYFNEHNIDPTLITWIPMKNSHVHDTKLSEEIYAKILGKNVIFVDIVPPERVLVDFVTNGPLKCVVLDHHKGVQKTLEKYPLLTSNHIYFDMTHSGVMLAWQYCYGYDVIGTDKSMKTPPHFLELIEDRDIWSKRFTETSAFVAAFYTSIPFEFEAYAKMEHKKDYNKLLNDGEIILKYQNIDIDQNILPTAVEQTVHINGNTYNVYIINTNVYISDIGAKLSSKLTKTGEPCDFVVMWYYNQRENVVRVSLRSDSSRETPFDVSAIARYFGGNGHQSAAGFTIEYPDVFSNICSSPYPRISANLLKYKPFLQTLGFVAGGVALGVMGTYVYRNQ